MSPRLPAFLPALITSVAATASVLVLGAAAPALAQPVPVEPFADYQPATHCHPAAKPGTTELGRWLVRHYGGGFGPISRSCGPGGATSEHNEGRAFDWMNDATDPVARHRVHAFMHDVFAADRAGDLDARARRMGIMYVIWDDHMYPAWDDFQPEPYLSSGCRSVKHCSTTLRHRDHVHISLSRPAARAGTSWYERRAAARDSRS